MEVTYTITLEDYVAYSMHTMKRLSYMKWRFGLRRALILLGCGLGAALLVDSDPGTAKALAFGGVFYAVIYPLILRAWVRRAIRRSAHDLDAGGVTGRTTLVLADDTLIERTGARQTVARWQDMKGVEEVGDFTFIYVTELEAIIIPRHGFARVEDYEGVRDFAVAKLAKPAEPSAAADPARESASGSS